MATYTWIGSQSSMTGTACQFVVLRIASTGVEAIRQNIPRYSIINSAVASITAKRDGTSSMSMYNHDMQWAIMNHTDIVKTLSSKDNAIAKSDTTFSQTITSYVCSDDADAGYLNDAWGTNISWLSSGTLSKTITISDMRIVFNYTAPVMQIRADVQSGQGTVQINGGTAGASATVTEYVTIAGKTYTIKATPASGYKFKQWSDGDVRASRSITVSDGTISAHGTEFFYYAIFEEEEQNNTFVGTKRSAAYVGTSRAAVYVGTKKVN